MRAVHIATLDGPEAVSVVDVDKPTRKPDEVLIEVHAAGVAFPEVLQSRGKYQIKPDLPFVPGAEIAGVVVEAPDGANVQAGDRVAALSMLGGFAEYAVAEPGRVFKIPDNLSFEQAAALPFNYMTAHFALLPRGRMAAGETVLVHGAAGGVGTASIQVAKAFGAGKVIAVTSTDEKGAIAVEAGADEYVLADGFKDAVKEVTNGEGVDIVLDPVGGERFTDSLRSLRAGGRVLVVGFTEGSIPEVKVNRLLLNNIDAVGVGWGAYAGPRPGYFAWQWEELEPKVASGELSPPIGATFGMDEVTQALLTIDERRATGKIILSIR
ncbi:zinc-binding dehydrogenase [Epidermidibacterium keratini]|uniref:Zinc-binding dehydrogenase n=1 Tax=Epidermidibacterium keratini TaxID=1891644 RepID=A0A7L4YJL0_9ACTN|nr:NADPH:quinone oxidoreductase family protein [Epidermidibacterium keratini]QHB99309.1 zinc-binding dehydrogenase [Epidermidibacterium keratini]